MEKHRKEIAIDKAHIKPLTIEAIEKGFGNLKNYIEHLVSSQAEKAIKSQKKS